MPLFATGDEIVQRRIQLLEEAATDKEPKEDSKADAKSDEIELSQPEPIEFGAETPNWPFFIAQLQWLPEGSTVKLTLEGRPQRDADADRCRGLVSTPIGA